MTLSVTYSRYLRVKNVNDLVTVRPWVETYFMSRASHTVELAPNPNFPTI